MPIENTPPGLFENTAAASLAHISEFQIEVFDEAFVFIRLSNSFIFICTFISYFLFFYTTRYYQSVAFSFRTTVQVSHLYFRRYDVNESLLEIDFFTRLQSHLSHLSWPWRVFHHILRHHSLCLIIIDFEDVSPILTSRTTRGSTSGFRPTIADNCTYKLGRSCKFWVYRFYNLHI